MTDRLRSWRERVAMPSSAVAAPNPYPAVLWPPPGAACEMTPDDAVWLVQRMVGTLEDEPFEEPTQDQIDEWLIAMTAAGGEE
jgi:hypothetical protein